MRLVSIAVVGVLALAGCSPSPAETATVDAKPDASQATPQVPVETAPPAPTQDARATPAEPGAEFKRTEPSNAVMILSGAGDALRVSFRAGGIPNGAATAADCEIQAIGPQDADDVITARVVPFETEMNTITAADIGAKPIIIEVRVGPEGVIVRDSGAAGRLCGVGSDIDGFYRRTEIAY